MKYSREKISELTNELLDLCREEYDVPFVMVFFDNKRSVASAINEDGFYAITYNLDAEDLGRVAICHEVAHILCMHNPALGLGHDRGWFQVYLDLIRKMKLDLSKA